LRRSKRLAPPREKSTLLFPGVRALAYVGQHL
jgi:hypothetical protein